VPTILLAQEDSDAASHLTSLLQDFFPTAQLQLITDFPSLVATLASASRSSLLLSDIFWADSDQSGTLLLLAETYPELPIGIVSRYDLTQTLPPAFPIPWLKADDHLPLAMAELMENFSGRNFGSYTLTSRAGPHPLGRLYWAKHHQLERQVQILIPPVGSPHFAKAIRAYARLNHAGVYSLYESVPSEQRIFVALEPVIHPTLLHLQNEGGSLPILPAARLATSLASVLSEMESSSIPARLLGPYDYTLSPNGTPAFVTPPQLRVLRRPLTIKIQFNSLPSLNRFYLPHLPPHLCSNFFEIRARRHLIYSARRATSNVNLRKFKKSMSEMRKLKRLRRSCVRASFAVGQLESDPSEHSSFSRSQPGSFLIVCSLINQES